MIRVLDQRDHLVKENQKLQEQLEHERMKVSVLKKEKEQKEQSKEEQESRPLSTVGI
ncbi:hypothetical protein [Halobacillus litoralis]|uniref:hypothetical protein n=1 Tax=Halobacillus litoralis TaxID=45668 RepID=UPI001CFDCD42|nr:hypothetical protein [Halobacillus litoralis]